MPTLSFDKRVLLNLVGKELSDEELTVVLEALKPSVEKLSQEELVLELTPERPDLFSVEGLARALRAYLGIEKGFKAVGLGEPRLEVKVERVEVRPYVACAVVRNVELSNEFVRSMMNFQEVLHETLGRHRRKVAIGVHDLDAIKPPIAYTAVKPETQIYPLGCAEFMSLAEVLERVEKGKLYGHLIRDAKLWPVYMDAEGVFSFPPLINSERTRVSEQTRNLFIELTGVDELAVQQTLVVLITNLIERGGEAEAVKLVGSVHKITPELKNRQVSLNIKEVKELLGFDLSGQAVELLERMGYAAELQNSQLKVIVPPYRVDVLHPVDVVEDLAIAYGYQRVEPELPSIATTGRIDRIEAFCQHLRTLLVGMGFQEIDRFVLSNPIDQFERMLLKQQACVELTNPVSERYSCLRVWLLPSLLEVLAANKHVSYPQRLFEVGDVVLPDETQETKSLTLRKLAGVIAHGKAGFAEVKSVVECLLKNLGIEYKIQAALHPSFIQGRTAKIVVDKEIGVFGEVHPEVLERWRVEVPVVAFEVEVVCLLKNWCYQKV